MRRASHVSASVTATSYSLMPHHHQFTSLPIGQRTRAFSYSLSPCFSSQVNRPQAMRGNYCTCSCSFASLNDKKRLPLLLDYCQFYLLAGFLMFYCFQNEIWLPGTQSFSIFGSGRVGYLKKSSGRVGYRDPVRPWLGVIRTVHYFYCRSCSTLENAPVEYSFFNLTSDALWVSHLQSVD